MAAAAAAENSKESSRADIEIIDIIHAPQYIDAVAKMCFNEWPEECKDVGISSVEDYAADIRNEYMTEGNWPLLLVAIEGSTRNIVGTVALDPNDMDDRPELKPWMASLLVTPGARGRGIGSMLITSALRYAGYMGCLNFIFGLKMMCVLFMNGEVSSFWNIDPTIVGMP